MTTTTFDDLVTLTRTDNVALAVLHAPRRNALTPGLADAIVAALDTAAATPQITAFVVASDHASFCSGADLDLLARVGEDPLEETNFEDIGKIYAMFARLQDSPLPTLAAVNGAAVGAGINLALACDLRIVAEDLRLIGFGRAAAHPGGGHLRMLQQLTGGAGPAVALFGQEVDARTALACGMAWRIVPNAQLRSTALETAAGAGSDGRLARLLTRSYRAAANGTVNAESAIMIERAAQLWSLRRRKT